VGRDVQKHMHSPSNEWQIPFLCDEKNDPEDNGEDNEAMRPVIEMEDIGRNGGDVWLSRLERSRKKGSDKKDPKREEIRQYSKEPGELSLLYFSICGNHIRPKKMGQDIHLNHLPKDHLL